MKDKHWNIKSDIISDDWSWKVTFDATPWFEQASDADILELAKCDFGGDYPADDVARFFEDRIPGIAATLEHCRQTEGVGFECHIDADHATEWLKENKPDLNIEI